MVQRQPLVMLLLLDGISEIVNVARSVCASERARRVREGGAMIGTAIATTTTDLEYACAAYQTSQEDNPLIGSWFTYCVRPLSLRVKRGGKT